MAAVVAIERPIDDVWAFVTDTRNDPKWMSNVIEVGRNADRPLAVGLEVEETVKFYGVRFSTTLTVTEHEPPTHTASSSSPSRCSRAWRGATSPRAWGT